MSEKKVEIFEEILESSKLSAYQNLPFQNQVIRSDDPSFVWQQLFFNPAFAMMIYDDMEEKDGIVSACLETRRNGVLSKPRRIKAASDSAEDKKIADFVEETLFGYMNFDAFLEEAYEAIPKGVAIGEKVYADGGDRIYIERVNFHPQHYFTFGEGELAEFSDVSLFRQTGPLRLRAGVTMENWTNTLLPEEKFYVFSYRPRYGNRWGTPLDRKCYWASWMKRASAKQWLKYLEKGTGAVVARYNDGSAEGEIATALDAATAMVEESAVAIPKKFLLEVHEMVRSVGSSHKEFVDDYCKSELAQIILGQTLTTRGSEGGGGSRALGQVHQATQHDRLEVDAKQLMASVNHKTGIVNDIVFWNFGAKAKRPEFVIEYETKEDINSKAERFGIIHRDISMPLSKKQVREELELDEPLDEADTLEQTAPAKSGDNLPNDKEQKAEFAEKKKDSSRLRRQVELEDGTLSEAAPVYDSIFRRVISEIEVGGLRVADFGKLLSDDFQQLENTLSEGIFAAYLLGFDTSNAELQTSIQIAKNTAEFENLKLSNFADGDKLVEQIGDDDLNLQLRFDVPPTEAIDYFKRKRVLTKKEFNKLEREAKAAAFTVQGIYEDDVLEAFKSEISDALKTGQTQKFVVDKFKKILDGGGHKMLGEWHLENVFRTNMMMAYGVGRRKAMEESAADLPYWEYSAVGDDRTRPTHQALDGITFPANHPFWDTHYPPIDYACRCSVIAVSNYRKDYNHDSPNAETTIAYDDEGLPAKAEFKTQVVDLKATKFVGVPKSANLEKALKENAKRARENRKTK